LTLGRGTRAGVPLGVTDWKVVERVDVLLPENAPTGPGAWRGIPGPGSTGHARERSALARRDDTTICGR
jgi:hypothetical protein